MYNNNNKNYNKNNRNYNNNNKNYNKNKKNQKQNCCSNYSKRNFGQTTSNASAHTNVAIALFVLSLQFFCQQNFDLLFFLLLFIIANYATIFHIEK